MRDAGQATPRATARFPGSIVRGPTLAIAAGGAAWLVVLVAARPPFVTGVTVYAPLVLAPAVGRVLGLPGAAQAALAVAAAPLLLAVALPVGVAAGALVVPWLAVAGSLALHGAWSLGADLRGATIAALGRAGALGFLAVSAVFLVLARAGVSPLGFAPVIVELTAIHFSVAGFVLLGLTAHLAAVRGGNRGGGGLGGRGGRRSGGHAGGPGGRVETAAILGLLGGMPVTALGFLGVPAAGFLGPLLVSAAGAASGVAHVRLAATRPDRTARVLFRVAGLSLVCGMFLAIGWAVAVETGTVWLDLPAMARLHGSLNAFGFGLLATLAWSRPGAAGGDGA